MVARARSGQVLLALALCLGGSRWARADEKPPRAAEPAAAAPAKAGPAAAEATPKKAPATTSGPPAGGQVVSTDETQEGVKTYAFEAVEVEGRLRSPQIIYFLRRVRAAFDAGGLGHRSFMRELSETRRHPAFK